MDRMDVARSSSITPPQRYFDAARKQIEGGHYEFTVDLPVGTASPDQITKDGPARR